MPENKQLTPPKFRNLWITSALINRECSGLFKASSIIWKCHACSFVYKVVSKNTKSDLAGLPSHNPFLMLNVKQESCGYQLSKFFGQTRPQFYRLQGGRSNY